MGQAEVNGATLLVELLLDVFGKSQLGLGSLANYPNVAPAMRFVPALLKSFFGRKPRGKAGDRVTPALAKTDLLRSEVTI
jgi:hypothetical protein